MGITGEDVERAAEALVVAGKEPTYLLVRERLGTGSFGTIARHLREWRARGAATAMRVPEIEMSTPFRDAVVRWGAEVWKVALAGMQDELRAARAGFEQRIQELAQEAERAAEVVDVLQEQRDVAAAGREELRSERERMTAERDALACQLAAAEGALGELRSQVERAEARAAEAERRSEERAGQIERESERAAEANRRWEEARTHTTSLQSSLESTLREYEALRVRQEESLQQLAAAQGALTEARAQREQAEARLRDREAKLQELAKRTAGHSGAGK